MVYKALVGFFVLLCALSGNAQQVTCDEIRISSGHLRVFCGRCSINRDTYFRKQLAFTLKDSTLWFRKREKKRFKKVDAKTPNIFLAKQTYDSLDVLYRDFTNYRIWGEKFSVYKVELMYYAPGGQLPLKAKSMIFLYNPVITDGGARTVLEKIIDSYVILSK